MQHRMDGSKVKVPDLWFFSISWVINGDTGSLHWSHAREHGRLRGLTYRDLCTRRTSKPLSKCQFFLFFLFFSSRSSAYMQDYKEKRETCTTKHIHFHTCTSVSFTHTHTHTFTPTHTPSPSSFFSSLLVVSAGSMLVPATMCATSRAR